MNHKWNYRPITQEQAEISRALAQELGISPVLGRLFGTKGNYEGTGCQEILPSAIARFA